MFGLNARKVRGERLQNVMNLGEAQLDPVIAGCSLGLQLRQFSGEARRDFG